jgi:hypothetical protein
MQRFQQGLPKAGITPSKRKQQQNSAVRGRVRRARLCRLARDRASETWVQGELLRWVARNGAEAEDEAAVRI